MTLKHIPTNYVFPRIPLRFALPDNYPEAGRIANISVLPEISSFHIADDEIEVKGSYQVNVSYFKNTSSVAKEPSVEQELKYDPFFSALKVQPDGLFAEEEDQQDLTSVNKGRELYTVSFSKLFHTFVDLEFINQPRSFKPMMGVERVNLEPAGGRVLSGELVLELINRNRRGNK